jgi:hypothetical protein
MSTKSREVIWGGQVRAAKMNAESARQRAKEAAREADRAEAYAWSLRMEGFGGPAQPSPTIGQCLNGGYGWMEAELPFAKQAPASRSMPSAVRAIRRSGNSKVRSDAVPAKRVHTSHRCT